LWDFVRSRQFTDKFFSASPISLCCGSPKKLGSGCADEWEGSWWNSNLELQLSAVGTQMALIDSGASTVVQSLDRFFMTVNSVS
jgi:hypothetical protein